MALGPGKYDDVCAEVLLDTMAQCAIVIIVDGVKGSGFSMKTKDPRLLATLPDMLEVMAKQIRNNLKKGII